MADEIVVQASLAANKSGAAVASGLLTKSLDMAGDDMETGTTTATDSGVTYPVPSSIQGGGVGFILVANLGSSEVKAQTTGGTGTDTVLLVPPGAHALFRPMDPTMTGLVLTTTTAGTTSLVQVWMVEL